jgi:hypothetical protein
MSIREFYPFQTKPESIHLELTPVEEGIRRTSDGSLILYEMDVDSVTINASVNIPPSVFEDVLDKSEQKKPPVKAILTYKSIESRCRKSINLKETGNSECSLEFNRTAWRGAVELQACLVRVTDNPGIPEQYANRSGALLAWSESLRLLFDEPRLPPGDYLKIIWKDFAESEEWLRRQSDHLFALDITGETPVIVLNQGIHGAYQVLNNKSNSGTIARIRDATFYMIVHQVWSSLIAEALINLSETRLGDEDNVDLVLDEISGWQQGVIMDWAPKLYPEQNADESLPVLISAVRQDNWSRELLYRRLPEAIQKQYRTWSGFTGLIQEVG